MDEGNLGGRGQTGDFVESMLLGRHSHSSLQAGTQ